MTPDERKSYIAQRHQEKVLDVAMYIAMALESTQDKECVYAPYAFDDHLIVFLLYPKYNEVNVLDSLDKDSKTYQEFLRIIDLAFKRGIISEADNAKTQENAYSSSISGRVTSNRWEQYYADITVVSS